ncbi:MAG: hypothetical protein R3B41_00300 [Candidatus Doudnabacteria bacterium]
MNFERMPVPANQEQENNQSLDKDIESYLKERGQLRSDLVDLSLEKLLNSHPEYHTEIANRMIYMGQVWDIAKNLEKFKGLDHIEIANRMIDRGKADAVAANLEKFEGLNHTVIANRMIDKYKADAVAANLEKFDSFGQETALKLIDNHEYITVADNLEKFDGLNHTVIANRMIDNGQDWAIAKNPEKFEGLGQETALKLIDKDQAGIVAKNLEKFDSLGQETALALIDKGQAGVVADNLEKFKGLDHIEIANRMIDKGQAGVVAKNLEKFKGLDHIEIANRMIDESQVNAVAANLEKFKGLDHIEIANRMIDKGKADAVAANLEKFKGLDHIEIANRMIDKGKADAVAANLEKFEGLNHTVIANHMIDKDQANAVIRNFFKFYGLGPKIALKLIDKDQADAVAANLERFEGLNHTVIANHMIDKDQANAVIRNFFKFKGLGQETALKLIDKDKANVVIKNLSAFKGQDHIIIANHIIDSGQAKVAAENLSKFEGLDCGVFGTDLNRITIANRMIDKDQANVVVNNFFKFEGLGQETALKLIDKDQADAVVKKLEKFKGLGQETAYGLAQAGYIIKVIERTDIFPDLDRITLAREACKRGNGADALLHNRFTFTDLQLSNEEYTDLAEKILTEATDWQDQENIAGPYRAGREIFGDRFMLEYLADPNLSRHDGLHAFNKIIELYESTDMKPKTFYGNILKQVAMDGESYEEGSSHHHLNSIALSLNRNYEEVAKEAALYDIPELQELVEHYKTTDNIFSSWGNLKRYSEISQLLERTELLEDVQKLRAEGREKLYNYVIKLAFHKNSKVDLGAVMQFWKDTERFLDADDEHTNDEIQSRKKPSNYIRIPHLDLNASELVDAYVEGSYDNLQVFNPMEIRYVIDINGRKETMVARINKKSDPDGALAGNDTACCMPFGSGKNTVYMFNPNTALFTLQIEKGGGSRRTIAQSVLTKDTDVKISVPEIIEKMQDFDTHLNEVASENILKEQESILACDNVEVAKNYTKEEHTDAIEDIYRDFFTEYLNRYGERQNFNTEKVVIGMGYSDSLTHLPEEKNTFVPKAPVGYSDKTGKNVYRLDLIQDKKEEQLEPKAFISKTITDYERDHDEQKDLDLGRGIDLLTFEDSLPVAYLEGKIYKDNESLMVYLHNIENGLIAKDVNNEAKGRPNMSLKYTDEKGYMRGYIFAYEGKLNSGERGIYITDLAADSTSKLGGRRLIKAFAKRYKKEYLDKGNLIPIYAEARDSTSYRIINKQLERIGQDLGIEIEIEKTGEHYEGDDLMHDVYLRPRQV